MNLYAETALYGMQFAALFFLAGPVLVRAERQRTLSRNPEWVSSNPEFLKDYSTVNLAPLKAASVFLAVLLAAAAITSSTVLLFAVHGPVFLLTIIGLGYHYNKSEVRIRTQIPKDGRQRAPLVPRSLFRFLPAWSVLPLAGLLVAIIAINGYGLFTGSISPGRGAGNVILLGLFLCGVVFGFIFNVNRQPYRTSGETDTLARIFELRLILAAGYFLCFVALYHAIGSIGPDAMLPQPPTMIHAWFEGTRFSWEHFFNDFHYRVVDYSATLFLIMLSVWISINQFYKRILIVDFGNPPNPVEV